MINFWHDICILITKISPDLRSQIMFTIKLSYVIVNNKNEIKIN